MADTPGQKPAEEQTPQEAVPTSEQKVPEPTEAKSVAQPEEAAQPTGASEEKLELPEGVSERTRQQFDKLKSQLKEYRQRLFGEEIFKDIQPEPAKEGGERPLYDPKTGLVDSEALNALQKDAAESKKRARRAEQAVQSYIYGSQERELYDSYPELNPKADNFNEQLYDTAQALALHSQAYPERYGGKSLTYKQAADEAKRRMTAETKPEEKPETPKQAAERLTPKEQASLEASGRPTQGVQKELTEEDAERQRVLTRLGDRAAMTDRMSRIPEVPASRKEGT